MLHHSDPTLVDDVVTYLNGKEVAGVYDASSHGSTLSAICKIPAEAAGGNWWRR